MDKENDQLATILTLGQVANYLRVHPSTVYRLLKERRIPAFRIVADWRFDLAQIDHWRLNGAQNK